MAHGMGPEGGACKSRPPYLITLLHAHADFVHRTRGQRSRESLSIGLGERT